MEYKIDKKALLEILEQWNRFLKRRVHLIACGGTAMTLLGVKASTKDVDFMIPRLAEYNYLINMLKKLGYEMVTGCGWQRKGDIFRRQEKLYG
jgi:peroxiredoxin family protein